MDARQCSLPCICLDVERESLDLWEARYSEERVRLCRLPTAGRNLLKDQLVNVVANALYYNPVLALQQLQAQGRTQAFFTTWFQVNQLLYPPETALRLARILQCAFWLPLPSF